MSYLKSILMTSVLFFSNAWAETSSQHLFCQFWSSSTYSPVVINLKNNFEATQTETQSCVYQNAQATGIDLVGLCLKYTREGIDQNQATKLQADLVSGLNGVYKTRKTFSLQLQPVHAENFILTADFENGIFTSGLCSFQK